MSHYSLDMNTCIEFLRQRNPAINARIAMTSDGDIRICATVEAELYFGAYRSQRPVENVAALREFLARFRKIPFDDASAEEFGRLRAFLERKGRPIDLFDLQIAAIALVHGLTLVTHNTREFSTISGLSIEDWQSVP